MEKELIKKVVGYVKLSPNVNVKFNDDNEYRVLTSFKDKKMRLSLAKAIEKELIKFAELNESSIIFATDNEIPTEIKSGMRGEYSAPLFVKRVELSKEEIETFCDKPKDIQRTAKEQADFLFGQLIAQVGGEEWINEQTWIARNKDIIHNNNKGNVAYTRLRIMLQRCFNIYNNFSNPTTKEKKTKKNTKHA